MSGSEVCGDNRFELVAKYRAKLIDGTNIEDRPEEMDVIDNVLFRFWQMGLLDRLEVSDNESIRLKVENSRLRKLCKMFAEYVSQDRCEGCCCKCRCRDGLIDECWMLTNIRELASELEIEVD